MTTIVLDHATVGRFADIQGEAEVLDETGRFYGMFVPKARHELCGSTNETLAGNDETDLLIGDRDSSMKLPPGVIVPFTEDEIERALAEPGGRPLRDILADLRARS